MKKRKRRKNKKIGLMILISVLLMSLTGITGAAVFLWKKHEVMISPDKLLLTYASYIENQDYEAMYAMLSSSSKDAVSEEDFIARNQKIYEGIKARDIQLNIQTMDERQKDVSVISYSTKLDSAAGPICFDNQAVFIKEKELGYGLEWHHHMIFPNLEETDKVKVTISEAKRGNILDRNGALLAGEGTASSIGLVPGKMEETPKKDISKLAALLDLSEEAITRKLKASWVKDDLLVPIKTIATLEETELPPETADAETLQRKALLDNLLAIKGVMISKTQVRTYPLKEKASHLTGYVQNITAEELEKHQEEGYRSNSIIGKSGLEKIYEKTLKGKDGFEIAIVTDEGKTKEVLAAVSKEDGKSIQLTIDAKVQETLYNAFKEDKSCSVAMNPLTGEILALVSTPSYDSNDFIYGMSDNKWRMLSENKANPLYNRFRAGWCPGSSFKPIIAAIGLDTSALSPKEDYGSSGLRWQKDSSWGSYYVTTLHNYEPVTLENALIYSDNIYFAKSALKIGADTLSKQLNQIGFNQKLPFDIEMFSSRYSSSNAIATEVQLADSGYGQGQLLLNPLHLAAIYTAFVNDGTILKPYLLYREDAQPENWFSHAFTPQTAKTVKNALIKAVNTPAGTGYRAHMPNITLAGKTGTAEIKASKEDTSGTELGWFGVFTADPETEYPILIISMVEDVKEKSGSGYVVSKDKVVLEQLLYSQKQIK